MSIGRNEPCWCGSGKKYKKCHLDSDAAAANPDAPHPGVSTYDPEHLIARVHDTHFSAALKLHDQDVLRDLLTERFGERRSLTEPEMNDFVSWVVFDTPHGTSGRTVLEAYLAQPGLRIREVERRILEGWAGRAISLYEVVAIRPGTGVDLKDLLSGGTLPVNDIRSSETCRRGQWVLLRIVPFQAIHIIMGNGITVPEGLRGGLIEWLNEERSPGESWPAVMRRLNPRLNPKLEEIGREWQDNLRLANSAGDPLAFCKARYRVANPASVIAALSSNAFVDRQPPDPKDPEKTSFALLDTARSERKPGTGLASMHLSGEALEIECNSERRLAHAMSFVAGLAPGILEHLGNEVTDWRTALERHQSEKSR